MWILDSGSEVLHTTTECPEFTGYTIATFPSSWTITMFPVCADCEEPT